MTHEPQFIAKFAVLIYSFLVPKTTARPRLFTAESQEQAKSPSGRLELLRPGAPERTPATLPTKLSPASVSAPRFSPE